MGNTDIIVNGALINSEQKLMGIYGILQLIQPCHLVLTSLQPSGGAVYRILHILSAGHTGRTFVKRHGNGGAQIGLNLHTLLRSHKNLSSIYM